MIERHILVVDDDPFATDAMACLLEMQGYGVFKAGDGRQALEILNARQEVRLIITDVKMPNMDGKELLNQMHQDSRFKKIPVIVVCASQRYVEELRDQAVAVMLKPVDASKLLRLVESQAGLNINIQPSP